jgi:hypothetical protein
MEPQRSLPCSKELDIGTQSELGESSCHPPILYLLQGRTLGPLEF